MYDFLKEYDQTKNAEIISEAAIYFEEKKEDRIQNLLEFIKDFVESEEFQTYLNIKKNIVTKEASTQYSENDYIITPAEELMFVSETFPLTKRSQWIHTFTTQFEKYLKRKTTQHVIQKQKQGIQMIKDRIAHFRTLYCCISDKKSLANKRPKFNVEELCMNYGIAIGHLKPETKDALRDKFISYKKAIDDQLAKRQENYYNIIRKLSKELAKEPQRKVVYHRPILRQPVQLEKPIFEYFEEESLVEEAEEEESPADHSPTPIAADISEKKTKKDKDKSKGKDKKEKKSDKASKKDKKKKKDKKSKKSKKKKGKKEKKFILPVIPICNVRRKINSVLAEEFKSLLEDFQTFDNTLQEEYMLSVTAAQQEYAADESLISFPQYLVYNEFHCGKRYRKKLLIFNKGHKTRKFRILSFKYFQNGTTNPFLVEPLPEIMKIAKGCTVQMSVVFIPEIESVVEGELILLTYSTQEMTYMTFRIPIKCIPRSVNLTISRYHIDFNQVPFWETANSKFKLLKLQNNGSKACSLVIKKRQDSISACPLEEEITEKNEAHNAAKDTVDNVISNIFGPFYLESYFIDLGGFNNTDIKIYIKNADYVGSYCEKYEIDVYEHIDDLLIGSHNIFVTAEVTGHFLKIIPEVIDFGVCIYNSIYQIGLEIENYSGSIQAACIKFPSSVSEYIKCDVSNIFIPAKSTTRVWIKLLPRHNIKNSSYFDIETSVLEIPIHIYSITKNGSNIPPAKGIVLAILTDRYDLHIVPIDKECFIGNVLDLGSCTTSESVFTYFKVKNNTMAKQICGFTNLPNYLTILPNFGFIELLPGEEKNMKIYFHPILKNDSPELEQAINYVLNFESLTKRGETKNDVTNKKLRRSVHLMLTELKSSGNVALYDNILDCKEKLKLLFFNEHLNEEPDLVIKKNNFPTFQYGEWYPEYEDEIVKEPPKEVIQLILKAKIIRPLVHPSFNHITLSHTPCGSYSSKEIQISNIGYPYKSQKMLKQFPINESPDYDTFFRIFSDQNDVHVQPNCGVLKMGETKKLVIFCVPSIPKEVVEETARAIKYEEIFQRKIEELKKKAEKNKDKKKKGKGKDKASKKGKDKASKKSKSKANKKSKGKNTEDGKESNIESNKEKPIDISKIKITEKELQLNYLDYFPAEMFCWRNLEPYTVNTKFWCVVRYSNDYGLYKEPDYFCLETFCTVVKPEFITNLQSQRINFGAVPIGISAVSTIILQNIKYDSIKPTLGVLNPHGPFRIPFIKDSKIPSEHCLTIPIKFEPAECKDSWEYFEITSGRTTLPLILEGVGVPLDLNIQPNFLVVRLETSPKKLAECPFTIKNNTPFDLNVTFEHICELVGTFKKIKPKEVDIDKDKVDAGGQGKKDKKGKKTGKKDKADMVVQKFSNELSNFEQVSLCESFMKNEQSLFYFPDSKTLEKRSTSVVPIFFGNPNVWKVQKEKMEKKEQKQKDKKGKKGGKVPDRGGRTSEIAPPPPEMPPWQQRNAGGQGGRGGGFQSRGGGGGGRGGNFQPRGGGNSYSSGFQSNQQQRGGYDNRSFDSAGSYSNREDRNSGSYENKGGYSNRGGYGNRGGGGRDNFDNRGGGRDNYDNRGGGRDNYDNRGGGGGRDNYDNRGGGRDNYDNRSFDNQSSGSYERRDSGGSYGSQDYQQSKRAKTYDSFQASKTTYADQYVQERQHNQQYSSRGDSGRGGGRSNYQRGGRGSGYR